MSETAGSRSLVAERIADQEDDIVSEVCDLKPTSAD